MVDKPGAENLELGVLLARNLQGWFPLASQVSAEARRGAQNSSRIRETSEDGPDMSPNGEPSQEGPAEPDQPRQQLGGWQHSKHTVLLCPGQLSLLGKSCGGGARRSLPGAHRAPYL